MSDPVVEAGFALPVTLSAVPAQGQTFDLAAEPAALAAIAERLAIPAAERLSGRIFIAPEPGGFRLSGRVSATLSRVCVVTLAPLAEVVDEPFDLRFASAGAADDAVDLTLDEDSPEPLDGDSLDIAEILVQQLALAMSPYPRRPDASFEAAEFGESLEKSPFAVLKGAIAERPDEE